MGELADEFMRFVYSVDPAVWGLARDGDPNFSATSERIYGAIVELENRATSHEAPIITGCYVDSPDLANALARAVDAEQRADALLAAVSRLVQTEAKVAAIGRVVEVSDRYRAETGWRTTLSVDIGGMPLELINVGGAVAVLSPATPPNPDLLERASVELAEEYIRITAERPGEPTVADICSFATGLEMALLDKAEGKAL